MKKTILTLTTILLIGCGSVSKNKTSEEVKTEKSIDTRTNTITTDLSDSFTLTPVDLSQPITFGGKTYTNTIIKYEKSNKVTEEVKDEKVEEKQNIEVKEKQVERDYTNLILIIAGSLLLLFIITLLFIAWQIKKINPLN